MALTKAALTMVIATIPELMALFYSMLGYRRTRFPNFLYMAWTWFFLWLGNLLLAIGYITLNFTVYRLGIVITSPLLFSISFMVDYISRNHFDPRKIALNTGISMALLIYAFEPNSIKLHTTGLGEITPEIVGNLQFVGSLTFLVAGLYWLYYMIKLHIYAPKHMKSISWINVIGAIFEGPGSIIAFASGFVWFLPGTDYLMISIGALLSSYSFTKEPKLGYVLPFRAYRIIFVHTKSGIPLYSYSWNRTGFKDPSLFAGAINGISALLRESLNKWNVTEIRFDSGVLMIKTIPEAPAYCILITSRRNKMLKIGLEVVTQKFNDVYGSLLKTSNSMNIAAFKETEKIIHESFPFVVSYENEAGPDEL